MFVLVSCLLWLGVSGSLEFALGLRVPCCLGFMGAMFLDPNAQVLGAGQGCLCPNLWYLRLLCSLDYPKRQRMGRDCSFRLTPKIGTWLPLGEKGVFGCFILLSCSSSKSTAETLAFLPCLRDGFEPPISREIGG